MTQAVGQVEEEDELGGGEEDGRLDGEPLHRFADPETSLGQSGDGVLSDPLLGSDKDFVLLPTRASSECSGRHHIRNAGAILLKAEATVDQGQRAF